MPKVFLRLEIGLPKPASHAGLSDAEAIAAEQAESEVASRIMRENPSPVIPFSRQVADYDDFCREETRIGCTYYVHDPEANLYHMCVANRAGKWIAVPDSPPRSGRWINSAMKANIVVVGRNEFSYSYPLKPGERREIYMER